MKHKKDELPVRGRMVIEWHSDKSVSVQSWRLFHVLGQLGHQLEEDACTPGKNSNEGILYSGDNIFTWHFEKIDPVVEEPELTEAEKEKRGKACLAKIRRFMER